MGKEELKRGRFITIEGGEGAGKSTQAALLVAALAQAGIAALRTREPGGARAAEEIRRLLVEGAPGRWDAVSEALRLRLHGNIESRSPTAPAVRFVRDRPWYASIEHQTRDQWDGDPWGGDATLSPSWTG